jgi:hypothetical protein
MESWALALLVIGAILVSFYIIKVAIQIWARHKYAAMKLQPPQSHCDIDAFVNNHKVQNPVNAVKCVLSHQIQIGKQIKTLTKGTTAIPLEFYESPHVPGLYVSQRRGGRDPSPTTKKKSTTTTASSSSTPPMKTYDWKELLTKSGTENSNDKQLPIVVCTIRMGFGHHRLAYSVSSWAMSTGRPTIFHDLLNIDSRKCVCVYVRFLGCDSYQYKHTQPFCVYPDIYPLHNICHSRK